MLNKKRYFFVLLFVLINSSCFAQMKRERVNPGDQVEEVFWAPNIVGMGSVKTLDARNLNVTIMHIFGIATIRPVKNFFGLDIPPNVRLGLDYGILNRWSVGIGRSTFEKAVDLRTKFALLRQTKSGKTPISISVKGDMGVKTQEDGLPFIDDLSYFLSLMAARKINEQLSIQLAPMYAHFNSTVVSLGNRTDFFALGVAGEYHFSRRFALITEWFPVLSDRNKGTKNAFALGLNIETGGHVFQLFFASSDWETEQYILATNNHNFWQGDFRFGFNINRLFSF